jgi:hypothetical protein
MAVPLWQVRNKIMRNDWTLKDDNVKQQQNWIWSQKQPTDYSSVSHYHMHISFEVRPKIQPKILHQF